MVNDHFESMEAGGEGKPVPKPITHAPHRTPRRVCRRGSSKAGVFEKPHYEQPIVVWRLFVRGDAQPFSGEIEFVGHVKPTKRRPEGGRRRKLKRC